MKIFKDKEGNKLTFKEFVNRWKTGIEGITPIQKIKTQIGGTRIMLIGLFLGLCVSIYGWKNLWWVGIILIGALLNTGVQYLGLIQQRKILDNLEKQFEEVDEEDEKRTLIDGKKNIGKEDTPKSIILDDNELSILSYAEEFPENWKKISNNLDKNKEEKTDGHK